MSNLTELNNHLFAALDRLDVENLSPEQIEAEVKRAGAIVEVADRQRRRRRSGQPDRCARSEDEHLGLATGSGEGNAAMTTRLSLTQAQIARAMRAAKREGLVPVMTPMGIAG